MNYEIHYEKRALKELQGLRPQDFERVRTAINSFARERRGDVKLLWGFKERVWELRTGPFRVAFVLRNGKMQVLRIWRK